CLLVGQLAGASGAVVCVAAFVSVLVLKVLGLGSIAVFVSSLSGIAAGLVYGEAVRHAER
ncbi:MAG: hypothetical protein IKD61_04175, partial [Oscillospiraceae bacterium]|nr:hypothetical protein [Oscillospiraceae bacterium]